VRRLAGNDLLIVVAVPKDPGTPLPIGVAGQGFDGNLTSDSTRTDGFVLSTDFAPTILHRYGIPVPSEMEGEPLRTEPHLSTSAINDLVGRMKVIPDRRATVIVSALAAWVLVALAFVGIRGPLGRRASAALALAFAYMPLMLLAGAAIGPSELGEAALVALGAPALAVLTLVLVRGWWALAVACAITVVAYAIDVVTGSELTKLSLLGPDPIFGARFYGIGNELEALIAVMVPVGVGAALAAARESASRRVAIAMFLLAGGLAALIFGAGRFGADAGAAVVLPVGAGVAAVSIAGVREGKGGSHLAIAVVAAPIVGLAALAVIDLISGGNAHLTRSVLDAGGAGDLANVAERRLRLSAHDFAQAAGNPLFWVVVAGIAVAVSQWRRIDAWIRPVPAVRAGVIGACAAVAVGVLVNDSGASFLVLGSLALGATLSFAWAQASTGPY
jgi:hypothetical protein